MLSRPNRLAGQRPLTPGYTSRPFWQRSDLMEQEPGVWVEGPDGELIPDYESTFPEINEGEVVHGTVVRVDKDEVLVDIGYKSEGVIPVAELSIRRSVNPADEVSLGDEIDALVLTKEDAEGRLILSKKRARFELAWKNIERAAESGEPVDGRVIEVVKGGLILDLGVRGFLPASLVDIRRVQDLDEFLGQELRCKVIELNRSRNNVVLSRRAVLEEERKEQRQQILDRLQPGNVVEGQISNIVDFGAFVDLDGMDGLIHISELSWSHVNHPSEILEIGQTVQVKVLDIDRDRQRISLGLKQTQNDPWQQVLESYHENDVVEGRVTKVVTFGAFVEILPGVEGLVHISELAQHHVENPREVVSQGQAVNVKIIEIDGERRRLSLSLKRVEADRPGAAARRRRRVRAPASESRPLRPRATMPGLTRSRRQPTTRRGSSPSRQRRPTERAPDASCRRPDRRRPRPSRAEAEPPSPTPTRSKRGDADAPPSEPRALATRSDPPRRRRHHRRHRRGEERGARRVRAARRRDGLERRDRARAAAPRRGARGGRRAVRQRRRRARRQARPRRDRHRRLQRPGVARAGWRRSCIRSSPPSTSRGASSSRGLPIPPRRVRDRGAAALRGGRRGAVRQGRRHHRARQRCGRRARRWRSRSASSGCSPTRRRSRGPTTLTSTPARSTSSRRSSASVMDDPERR